MQGGSSTASSAAAAAAAAMFQGMRPPQFPEPEQQQLKCPRCESTNTKFCYYNNYNLSQPRHFCKSCRRYWTKGGSLRNIPVGGGTRKNSTKRSKSGTSGEDSDCNNNKDNGNATATAATKTDGNPAKRANNNTTTTNNHHPHHTNSASSPLTNPIPTQTAPAPAALTSADPPSSLPKPELLPPIYPSGEQEPRMFEIGGSFSSLLSSAPHFANLMSIPSLSGHHPLDLGTVSSTPHFGGCDDVTPAAPAPPAEEDFLNLQGDPGCWSTGDRSASGGGRSGGWPGLSIYPPDSDFH